jgi:ribA/ribD-fused uncharacterized protein
MNKLDFFSTGGITSFKEEYFSFSNFYMHEILYKGILYPSTEHAYVASKSDDPEFKLMVSKLETAGKAKRKGREDSLVLTENWDQKKLVVMEDILRIKFSDDYLKSVLLATGDRRLCEGNYWHDSFWGVDDVTGIGKNHLGKLLMKIRYESRFISII